eukprot:Skav204985  [mRNA]  locus=scaffold1180:568568:572082:- [translate_table: standard]
MVSIVITTQRDLGLGVVKQQLCKSSGAAAWRRETTAAAMDGEPVAAVSMEWKVLKERFFAGEPVDPVFEGIVKDFIAFDVTLQDIFRKVEIFMRGVDSLAEGLVALAESTTAGLSAVDDPMIKAGDAAGMGDLATPGGMGGEVVADCCKMKEATNSITRADAPHSAIAKLRRDMDFNIMCRGTRGLRRGHVCGCGSWAHHGKA